MQANIYASSNAQRTDSFRSKLLEQKIFDKCSVELPDGGTREGTGVRHSLCCDGSVWEHRTVLVTEAGKAEATAATHLQEYVEATVDRLVNELTNDVAILLGAGPPREVVVSTGMNSRMTWPYSQVVGWPRVVCARRTRWHIRRRANKAGQ